MSDAYRTLLDATIEHLESLQALGVDHVRVTSGTLSALTARVAVSPARPAPQTAGPSLPPTLAPTPSRTSPAPASVVSSNPSPPVRSSPAPSASVLSRWSKAAAMPPSIPKPFVPKPALPVTPPLSREEKQAALETLRSQVLACVRCPNLVASRTTVVFGVGDVDARLLFVGEAPGADEDLQGEPFVGKAGELLTKIITAMGLGRDSVFIANILKCRPDTPGQTSGNRKPRPDEMETCIPWLERQIEIIRPQAMVALGATAVEGLLGKNAAGITRLRGTWQEYRGIPVMPTYHPAYLLRNQAITEKRKVWEDMMLAMERVGYPISDKQRGFFLVKA
jgi:DNA polymerase